MTITSVTTKDGLTLYGMLKDSKKSKSIFIHTHGTGSSFYMEGFEMGIINMLAEKDIDSLFVNNRGAYLMEAWQSSGAAVEKFEDSVLDLDAWLGYATGLGYEKVILSGHSLGAEKVAYYMQYGLYQDRVSQVFLLGFSDTFGAQKRYLGRTNKNYDEEVKKLLEDGLENVLIADGEPAHSGELAISAKTYDNFYNAKTKLTKALPFGARDLSHLSTISVPVIGIIGDNEEDEWTIIPIDEALELLRTNIPHFTGYKIADCTHEFENKHNELIDVIAHNLLV